MKRIWFSVVALMAALVAVFILGPSEAERTGRMADQRALYHGVVRDFPPVPEVVGTAHEGMLAVDLFDGATETDLQAVEALLGVDLDWVHPLAIDEALAWGMVSDLGGAMAILQANPNIEAVEPVVELRAFELPGGFPNDPMYDRQWNLRAIHADVAWNLTPRGKGVVVAVLDTGVTVVEDLEGVDILDGVSFVPGESDATDGNGHGTHVAGTIAQATHNATGVAGIAPEATVLPVKVLSKFGNGTSAGIAAGIDYAVDQGADVINLSLGGPYSKVVHNAVRKARESGVLVVAAVGNSGRRGVSWPGGLAETIGVSALAPNGALAPYSSWGPGTDIAAPGGDKRIDGGGVLQDTIDGAGHAYKEFQGTSMATPHVSGAAAALLSTEHLTVDEVEALLIASARGDGWTERTGHGALDLERALRSTGDVAGGVRFVFGAVLGWILAGFGGRRRRSFRPISALAGGVAAGGLFMLPWWISIQGTLLNVLTHGVLDWPGVLFHPWMVGMPLWLSALVPLVVTVMCGPFRWCRPLALGFTAGVGAHLLYGTATGTLVPWLMSPAIGAIWLCGNATVCVVLALALAGVEKLDGRTGGAE